MLITIESIAGRKVRGYSGEEPGKLVEFVIAAKAEVTLNGKKSCLADLSNGDRADLRNGSSQDGYHKIEATRTDSPSVKTNRDLSVPREVTEGEIKNETPTTEPIATAVPSPSSVKEPKTSHAHTEDTPPKKTGDGHRPGRKG